MLKLGTKSVLFGAHAFWLHPWFVAASWWKLYGFPWDPRLWVAFWVHDLGYWGKESMDDPEGELHPLWGARVMTWLFDRKSKLKVMPIRHDHQDQYGNPRMWLIERFGPWGRFVLFHSRYLAKRHRAKFSRLCVADKLAISLEPWWLYLPRVYASGEIREYMDKAKEHHPDMDPNTSNARAWFADVCEYCRG